MRKMSYFSLKICLLGDTNVGKSSIALKFVENKFDRSISNTVGASFMWKMVKGKKGSLYKLNIWDTAGQERFRAVAPLFFRGAAVVLVVYNVASKHTLTNGAREWIDEVKRNCSRHVLLVLIGNKADLDAIREVDEREGREYAERIGALFFETSAKTGQNVRTVFKDICGHFEESHNRHLTLICSADEPKDRTISVISSTGGHVAPRHLTAAQCCD